MGKVDHQPKPKPGSNIVIGIFWTSMVFDWTLLVKLNSYLNLCKEQYGKLRIGHGIIISRSVHYSCFSISNNLLHQRSILNLCMPYTSRDEITTAVEACVTDFTANGYKERYAITSSLASGSSYFILFARPITEKDIDDHLMISQAGSPPLDILIRTSGVNRLSDFLLWQVRSI